MVTPSSCAAADDLLPDARGETGRGPPRQGRRIEELALGFRRFHRWGIVADMPTIDPARLEAKATRIFTAMGAPDGDAAWIAALLVRANLRGHDSHGVIRIPSTGSR